jgi:hypothetical protein
MAAELQKNFNPNEHLMKVSSKDYLPVAWRIVWFRSICPDGSIETEMLHLDLKIEYSEEVWEKGKKVTKTAPGMAVFRAIIKNGQGGVGTGTKSEKAVSFPDFIEKAETGAIGRALAALGYGTQFTGDELDEARRIVDSPLESRKEGQPNPSDLARRGAEDMARLHARMSTIKPKNKQGEMSFEQFCFSVLKRVPHGNDDLSVVERKRLNDQLDVIERMRAAPAEETA